MGRVREPAGKQAMLRLKVRSVDPRGDSDSRRLRQFKLHGPLRLSLHDHGAAQDLVAVGNVTNAKIDEITATQLAVDSEIEHGQVSDPGLVLTMVAIGP